MDGLEAGRFDLVTATLVFSELSPDEQTYALGQCHRLLKPGGALVLVDEVRPRSRIARCVHAFLRLPLLVVTYVLTQTTTRAVVDLEARVAAAGFALGYSERSGVDSFLYLRAAKKDEQ